MSFNIPENLKKYCSLSENGTIIDRFKCPVPGCNFTTRLGPGAIRMHIMINSDPIHETRYSSDHEEFFRNHESDMSLENIRTLANIPFRPVSYKKE
jgi:hypothetical protein